VKLVMISGSLRRDSVNTAVLRAAERYFKADDADVEIKYCVIDDLPLFNEDFEALGTPSTVARVRRQVEGADAVVISTPEYNGSVSGALKNALDWLSRPHENGVLIGKPVATMSASPANYGAVWAQENLRFVLEQCRARLINDELVALPKVFDALDSHGELADPNELAKVHALCSSVLRHSAVREVVNDVAASA
jgi:chromate reductase, NAD(P)H dehydrogenase (quinone)